MSIASTFDAIFLHADDNLCVATRHLAAGEEKNRI